MPIFAFIMSVKSYICQIWQTKQTDYVVVYVGMSIIVYVGVLGRREAYNIGTYKEE